MKEKKRCGWCVNSDIEKEYHDKEWGVPVHNDRKHFEFLLLDGFQAGLSWVTILKKRKNFKKAFDNFDYKKIVKYNKRKLNQLMKDEGIIRNKLKVESSVTNAKAFMDIQKEFGSFDKYIWQFTGGKPVHNKRKAMKDIPASTEESDAMSKDLKKRGFRFVGTTICYAYMQAAGMVNDHTVECFRHKEVKGIK